ncbi:MAG: VanZ family protein [Proteiniphilum sp.]|nr:VanZ family protein [Proteiniphilum sp.]
MRTLLRYTIIPSLIGLVIFIATCILGPGSIPDMPRGIQWDKLAHFGMFFLLSAVSLYDYYKMCNGNPLVLRWVFWGLILPVIYGGTIELMQKYIFTSRSAEWGDWIADILGSLAAMAVAIILLRTRKRKRKNISL